ncbi:MAG: Ig-like domain-containing protein, partial [Dehalococcoidia bacterium]
PDNLQPSTTYHARIPAGLTSAADGVLEADYEWEFSTFQPALATADPADGTSFVAPGAAITLVFNQAMERDSVEAGVGIRALGGEPIEAAASWSADSTTLTLTPTAPLAISTTYEVRVPSGLRGEIGGESTLERTVVFSTVDQPRLVSSSPSANETNAGRYGVAVEFNNPIDIDSLEEHLSISGFDREDWVVQTYGDDRYVQVDVGFEPSTEYTVTIAAGVVDRAGLALEPLSFTFTTGALVPQVSYAVPGQFATYASTGEQELFFFVTNRTSVPFELYGVPASQALNIIQTGYIPSPPGVPDWTPGGAPLRSWTVPVEGAQNTSVLASTTLTEGDPLPAGYYYVRTPGGDWSSGVLFAVVDTAIVTKLGLDELLVWAVDYATGEPVSGLSVTVSGPGVDGAQVRTGGDGVASVTVPR